MTVKNVYGSMLHFFLKRRGNNYSGTVLLCPLRLLTTAVIETLERILSFSASFSHYSVHAQKNPVLQFLSTVLSPFCFLISMNNNLSFCLIECCKLRRINGEDDIVERKIDSVFKLGNQKA